MKETLESDHLLLYFRAFFKSSFPLSPHFYVQITCAQQTILNVIQIAFS